MYYEQMSWVHNEDKMMYQTISYNIMYTCYEDESDFTILC